MTCARSSKIHVFGWNLGYDYIVLKADLVFKHYFGKNKNSCKYFVLENHKLYFEIPQILFCCFDFLLREHEILL
jgi:hypothetical protein